MKIEIGKSYRVVENRESFYRKCYDLVEVEGKIVTVTENAGNSEDYRIKDEFGKIHTCQACNLEEIKVAKKLEKVLCIKDGKMCGVGKQFCTAGKYYEVTKENDSSFNIIDDAGDDHRFTISKNVWFELIFIDEKELKVGDIVTGSQKLQWLDGGYAKIVKIKGEYATIEIIKKNDSEQCPEVGEMDSDWELKWLVKVTDCKQLEQLKDNIKEDGIVKNGFMVGDKIKIINWDSIFCVEVGDTAEIIGIRSNVGQNIKIRMDKDGEEWVARESEIEIVANINSQQLEIITSGTTTTVKLQDGREGVAKLYYKDKYSKGFGIVTALGKAMDIDLVGEVQKVVGSYELRGIKPKVVIADEVVFSELVEAPSIKFEVGCKVKIPKTKSKGNSMNRSWTPDSIFQARKLKQDYLFILRIQRNGIYILSEKNKGFGDLFGLEDLELYIETPSLKKPILKEEVKEKVNVNFKEGDNVRITKEIGGTSGRTSAGDTAKIKSVSDYDYVITMDKDGKNWFTDDRKLEAAIPVFKIGDTVKVREDLVPETDYFKGVSFRNDMAQYKGKTFKVTDVVLHYYTLGDISWSWTYDMLEKVEEKAEDEVTVTATEPEFKKGDKVKMISEKPTFGFGEVKTGDIGVIEIANGGEEVLVNFPNQKLWSAKKQDLELVVEDAAPEFKVGDKVYYKSLSGTYAVCEIAKILGNEVWGNWSSEYFDTVEELPKTKKEFETLRKNLRETYVRISSVRKLELVEEVKVEEAVEEFKVGDYIYFEMNGEYSACKIDRIDGNEMWGEWTGCELKTLPQTIGEFERIEKSNGSGFVRLKNPSIKKLVLVDDTMPKYIKGQAITRDKAIEIVNAGGTVLRDNDKYFLKGKELWVEFKDGDSFASSGFNNFYEKSKYFIVELPKDTVKEDTTVETYVVGQKLNEDESKAFIKTGGKVKDNDKYIYWEKEGKLTYQDDEGNKNLSSGYNNITYPATVHEVPKSILNN